MTTTTNSIWRDIYFTARDGLRLHARHYSGGGSQRRPVICLAGLTRNARDFHKLAEVLSDPRGHRRDVYALDYRGRGLSDHAPDASTYTIPAELGDVLDFMTMIGVADAAIIGTSRGGLIAMAMAAQRPTAMGVCVMNDIGPVIERDGLARIVAYVGRVPLPPTWAEARELVKSMNKLAFPNVSDEDWDAIARQLFNDENGFPTPGYDPKLSAALTLTDGPLPELWGPFAALYTVPMLLIRGSRSDILSAKTAQEMARRHPDLVLHTVEDEGHAPWLRDAPSLKAIYDFLYRTDPETETRTEGRSAARAG
jgi:pimeloyl-ACP methyl ester carboxylesterase